MLLYYFMTVATSMASMIAQVGLWPQQRIKVVREDRLQLRNQVASAAEVQAYPLPIAQFDP
jgi:hypothetical protein